MSLVPYTLITVYLREGQRTKKESTTDYIVERVRRLGLCARCLVTKASRGFFESGEVATSKIVVLSTALPEKIEIVLPEADAGKVLDLLDAVVEDGVVTAAPIPVVSHRTAKRLVPAHLQVRHVMSTDVHTTTAATPLPEAARALIRHRLVALPVVDGRGRVTGVFSQRDLFQSGYLHMRLGILSALDETQLEEVLSPLGNRTVADVMTAPAVTITETTYLLDALRDLISRKLKRMPAVDGDGRLTGLFARLDILKAITRHTPDWYTEPAAHIKVANARIVADAMRRDSAAVEPGTPLADVLEKLISAGVCCLPVLKDGGELAGVIFDTTIVGLFRKHARGLWDLVSGSITFAGLTSRHRGLSDALHGTTAGEVMESDVDTVRDDAPLEEAIRLMTTGNLRTLLVVDAGGRYRGLLNRTDLLLGEIGDESG